VQRTALSRRLVQQPASDTGEAGAGGVVPATDRRVFRTVRAVQRQPADRTAASPAPRSTTPAQDPAPIPYPPGRSRCGTRARVPARPHRGSRTRGRCPRAPRPRPARPPAAQQPAGSRPSPGYSGPTRPGRGAVYARDRDAHPGHGASLARRQLPHLRHDQRTHILAGAAAQRGRAPRADFAARRKARARHLGAAQVHADHRARRRHGNLALLQKRWSVPDRIPAAQRAGPARCRPGVRVPPQDCAPPHCQRGPVSKWPATCRNDPRFCQFERLHSSLQGTPVALETPSGRKKTGAVLLSQEQLHRRKPWPSLAISRPRICSARSSIM
jgi:hypothetical protein